MDPVGTHLGLHSFSSLIFGWDIPPPRMQSWPLGLWTIFRIGDSYKPSFATVTGMGPHPTYNLGVVRLAVWWLMNIFSVTTCFLGRVREARSLNHKGQFDFSETSVDQSCQTLGEKNLCAAVFFFRFFSPWTHCFLRAEWFFPLLKTNGSGISGDSTIRAVTRCPVGSFHLSGVGAVGFPPQRSPNIVWAFGHLSYVCQRVLLL